MAESGIQIEGMREAIMVLHGMSEAAADLTIALQAGADLVEKGALARWPVTNHTGKLRRSIMLRVTKTRARIVVAAKYSRYLQYGKRVHHKYVLLAPTKEEIAQVREILRGHVLAGLDQGEVKVLRKVLRHG